MIDAVCASVTHDTLVLAWFTHLLPVLVAVGTVFFLYLLRKTKDFAFWSYAGFTLFFAITMAMDLVLWITQYAEPVVPLWNLVGFGSIIFALFAWMLWFIVSYERLPSRWVSVLFSTIILVQTILIFTGNAVLGYDAENCEAIEGDLSVNFALLVQLGVAISILIGSIFFRKKEAVKKYVFSFGIVMFLALFTLSSTVASYTEIYEVELYSFLLLPILLIPSIIELIDRSTVSPSIQGSFAVVYVFLATVLFQTVILRDQKELFIDVTIVCSAVILSILIIKNAFQQVEAREHIEVLAKELQETNERQETLIHFIGHEVKGFLTKDSGAFAAIADGDFGTPPDGMKPFVEQALEESRRGADSVANILKASNLKKGTVTYTKAPFDLKALVASAVEKARQAAEAKGLSLSFTADEAGAPYSLTGDAAQISDHVLRNLIDNAINYTPSGSVAVSLKKEGASLVFSVKDSGVGITEEDKQRLFTEGGHGKDSQKVNVHSTGYGLYIAKQIAEAHGGTIRAESEGAGKGSTFVVEFPA